MKFKFPPISALCLCLLIIIEPTPYLLLMIASVFMHESGHLICMKLCGVRIAQITLLPIGIDIRKEHKLLSYKKEFAICAAGSAINLICFAVTIIPFPFFACCNLLYGIFNLLPIHGLDGGELTLYLCCCFFTKDRAERTVKILSFIFCILLWMTGIYILLILNGNISIFAIAVFLFISEIMTE